MEQPLDCPPPRRDVKPLGGYCSEHRWQGSGWIASSGGALPLRAFLPAVSLAVLEGSCCRGVGTVRGWHVHSRSCQTNSAHMRGKAKRGRMTELLAPGGRGLEFTLPAVKPYCAVLQWHLSRAAHTSCFICTCATCPFTPFLWVVPGRVSEKWSFRRCP